MRAVKGKDTSLERAVDTAFASMGWQYDRNVEDITGKPDFVFRREKVIVFVDGDFWHGWRFPAWKETVGPYWQQKIQRNRERDRRNAQRLRRRGWHVIRIWGHQVRQELEAVTSKVARALGSAHD